MKGFPLRSLTSFVCCSRVYVFRLRMYGCLTTAYVQMSYCSGFCESSVVDEDFKYDMIANTHGCTCKQMHWHWQGSVHIYPNTHCITSYCCRPNSSRMSSYLNGQHMYIRVCMFFLGRFHRWLHSTLSIRCLHSSARPNDVSKMRTTTIYLDQPPYPDCHSFTNDWIGDHLFINLTPWFLCILWHTELTVLVLPQLHLFSSSNSLTG